LEVIVLAFGGIRSKENAPAVAWAPGYSALAEELGEVFDSVAEAVRRPEQDADSAAACAFLLRHLASAAKMRTSSDIM
jgi:hypothetical protein